MYKRPYPDELYHYGVKGMKWGIRRTPAQLGHDVSKKVRKAAGSAATAVGTAAKKAGSAISTSVKNRRAAKAAEKAEQEKIKKVNKTKKKPLSEMSNDEIKEVVERLRLEQQYNQLQPKKTSLGQKFVNDILMPTATNAAKQYIDKVVKDAINGKDPNASIKKDIANKELKKKQAELDDYFATRDLKNEVNELRLTRQQQEAYQKLAEYQKQIRGYLPDKTS